MKKIVIIFFIALLAVPSMALAGSQATSGITAQTIINRLTQDVNDASGTLAASDEIVRWTDEAIRKIATEARCLETTEYVQMTAGQVAYSITTAHYDIESVYMDAGSSVPAGDRYWWLEKSDLKTLYINSMEASRPAKWCEWGSDIYAYPIPSDDYSATSMRVMLIKKPTGVSAAGDAIETPFYFDEAILMWCIYKYYKKDAKDQKAAFYRAQFEREILNYRMQIRKPLVQEATQ